MEQEEIKQSDIYNEEIERNISYFMSKKRRQIVETLYDKKRLSQGELAQEIQSSAASLSNILLHFEMFQYRLLDSESDGKRRYYFLTGLGKAFVQNVYRNKQDNKAGNVISHESFQDMQSIMSCLETIKNKYEDKWEITLEDVLLAGIKFWDVQIEDGEKEIDNFLYSIERVLVEDYENYSVRIMKLVYSNAILLDRMEQFLSIFEIFIPILKVWWKGFDPLQMYNFLEYTVTGDRGKAEQFIQQFQWEDRQFDKFSEWLQQTIKSIGKKDESEVYRYFNRFLAGDLTLSAILTKEVCAVNKMMKEKM